VTDPTIEATARPPGVPALTVVIPTMNRKDVLLRTLEALEHQTLERAHFEVIVVDDGSSDGTADSVAARRFDLPLRVLRIPNSGLAAARNRGWRAGRGAVVLFLDDDVIPAPDLLRQHLLVHGGRDDAVAIGSLPFHEDVAREPLVRYLDRVTFFDLYRNPRKYPGGVPPLPPLNGNSSVRRAHLERVGGYDETFRAYGGEDLDLGWRLQRSGLTFVYNADAVGFHRHAKGFEAFCRDQEQAGQAVARLAELHPEVRSAKKVDLVSDPWTRLRGRKLCARIALELLFLCPVPVRLARRAVRRLERRRASGWLLFRLYRLCSHYHYARGIRRYARERGPGPAPGAHVPLVRPAGPVRERVPPARDRAGAV